MHITNLSTARMHGDRSNETITATTTKDITIANMFRALLNNMALSLPSGENSRHGLRPTILCSLLLRSQFFLGGSLYLSISIQLGTNGVVKQQTKPYGAIQSKRTISE
jgi:hypothetical protein